MSFGKLNFSTAFKPTSAFPLDARTYFDSLEKAESAANTAKPVGSTESIYYIGQTLTVVEGDSATLYIIQPDLSLMKVGAGVVSTNPNPDSGSGEGSTIVVTDIKWEDIKDKPFYDNSISLVCDYAEGIPTVTTDFFNYKWYRIFDIDLTRDQLLKTKFTVSYDGTNFEEETPVESEIIFDEPFATTVIMSDSGRAYFVAHQTGDHVAHYQNMEIPVHLPKKGIYVAWGINSTPPSTVIYKVEYNDIKKLDDKFVNHDWSAVKNKPFYEEGYHVIWDGKPTGTKAIGYSGLNIKWDGALTDVYLEIQENPDYDIPHLYACKVAEPIEGTLEGYEFTLQSPDSSYTETITSETMVIEKDENDEVLYSANSDCWVSNFNKAGTYTLLGILDVTIEEAGIYFLIMAEESMYISSLKSPDYHEVTYYKVSEPVHSIQDAYAILHMFDSGEVYEETLQLNDDIGGIRTTSLGNSYLPQAPYLFNIVSPEEILLDLDGTHYKFSFTETGLYFLTESGAYISSLMSEDYEIHPLDEKFIPDSIARKNRVPEAYEIGTCVEWDIPEEVTDDDVIIDVGSFGDMDNALFFKVSEPLQESILGWRVLMKNVVEDAESESPAITEEYGGQVYESGSSSLAYAVNVVTPETLYIEPMGKDIEFPVAGLYFLIIDGYAYIRKLISPDYEVIQIDPKFIPNMTTDEPEETGDIGCPVLNLGMLQKKDTDHVIVDIYSVLASSQDYYNFDYSKGAYPQYDTFIISFTPNNTIEAEEGAEDITIHVATGYSSSGVTSSFPVIISGCTFFEIGLIYTIQVIRHADGTYKGVFTHRPTDNISNDEEYSNAVATPRGVYKYLSSLGLSTIDEEPGEYSKNVVRSKGIYKAIHDKATELIEQMNEADVQADMGEMDPSSLSYVKNKLVYDEPIYPNIYLDTAPSLSGDVTGDLSLTSFTNTGRYVKIADIPVSGMDVNGTFSYLQNVANIEMQDLLKDEVFEIVSISSWCATIKGTVNITDNLVVAVSVSGRYLGVKFPDAGLYILRVSHSEGIYYVNKIEYKTTPHKLPSKYLNMDDTPTEDSENPISSGAVYRAILGGQGTLQFDDTPTEGSNNLLTSGAVHKALSELEVGGGSGTLPDADDTPTEGSQNLVTSGGVHRAIESLMEEIDEAFQSVDQSLEEKATQSDIDSAINPLQQEIGSKANANDVYSKSEIDSTVNTFRTSLNNKADASNVYSKEEIDGKLTGAFHYLGTKDNYSDLPTENNNVGDVWNILNADTTHAVKAGDNVAWNGTSWDVLSGMVDLSAYAKQSAVDEQSRKLGTIEEGANKYIHPTKHSIGEVEGLDEALDDKVDDSLLGTANGVATLDESGKIPESQLPRTYRIATDEEIEALFNK